MFQILSYNIEFGRRLNSIENWIKKLIPIPEFICFQEFPAAQLNAFKERFCCNNFECAFTPAFLYKGQVYGELILSPQHEIQVLQLERIDLGSHPWERRLIGVHSQRSALLLNVQFHGEQLCIVNIHPPWLASNTYRLALFQKVLTHLHTYHRAVIVGDYNYTSLWGKHRLISLMKRHHFALANDTQVTHRYLGLSHQLDYVFYRNLKLNTSKVLQVAFSDHLPVLSTFEI